MGWRAESKLFTHRQSGHWPAGPYQKSISWAAGQEKEGEEERCQRKRFSADMTSRSGATQQKGMMTTYDKLGKARTARGAEVRTVEGDRNKRHNDAHTTYLCDRQD